MKLAGAACGRMGDEWSSGEAYERYVGRWSRLVARNALDWARVPRHVEALDVGCGTGALAEELLNRGATRVTGVDPSPAFVAAATERLGHMRAAFRTGDAMKLDFRDGAFDAVVSGLVLNFLPDPERGAREMARVARPGGVVAAYVWDYARGMEMMRRFWDAAASVDARAAALDEGPRFPVCRPDALERLLRSAGLHDVSSTAVDVPTTFKDFDDYWQPFLAGTGPAPAYAASLDERAREAIRERLHATLPRAKDGSIPLVARAWAVRGVRKA